MRKMLFFALAFALGLPLAAQEKGKIELLALEHELTAPNHVYGRALDPEDLGQRVVVLWNISRFVEPGYNRLKEGRRQGWSTLGHRRRCSAGRSRTPSLSHRCHPRA